MICQLYQNQYNLTDAQMCRLINDYKDASEPPVFEHRLVKLKGGLAQARGREIKALMAATDDEADRYN